MLESHLVETLPLTHRAADLKARILAGEKIPLDELREFILASNSTLEKDRKTREKPSDVDFF